MRIINVIYNFYEDLQTQCKRPSVKSALRPPPTAQAENEKSALFPGKRA